MIIQWKICHSTFQTRKHADHHTRDRRADTRGTPHSHNRLRNIIPCTGKGMPTPHQHQHSRRSHSFLARCGVVNFLRHSYLTRTHAHPQSSRVARATRIVAGQRTNQSQRDARAVWNGSDQVGAGWQRRMLVRERARESKIERERESESALSLW